MTNILLICHDIPSMTVGATLPIYHLIKNLGPKYDIKLICFDSGKYPINHIQKELKDIETIKIPEYLTVTKQLKYTIKNMISLDNLHTRSLLNYYYHKNMNTLIKNNVNDSDIIITDMPMAFYAKNINKPKIVYAFDAVSDYNHKMYKKSNTIPSKIYWYLNYLKIHNYEKVYNKFNNCIVVNQKDKQLLEKDIQIPITVVPNGVDTEFFKNTEKQEKTKLVFLGDMSTPPNNDAVKYFMEEIHPLIIKETEIDFFIVGRNPSNYILELDNYDNIYVTGSVEDVRDYLPRGTIFITPMVSGTGIKNKILEAMSMNLPVVSTSMGISGIDAEEGKEYLCADNNIVFKEKIMELINSPQLQLTIGDNARIFVENNYSWVTSMKKIEELINELI
ncbi:MAG: glycosyltransferase [Methanosphaera stadtmanae]|nr:glycosyltransferase [Methanosphaera stadtmanae]